MYKHEHTTQWSRLMKNIENDGDFVTKFSQKNFLVIYNLHWPQPTKLDCPDRI